MKKTSLTPNLENFQSITTWLNNNFNEKKINGKDYHLVSRNIISFTSNKIKKNVLYTQI